jgi:hypothetical protein
MNPELICEYCGPICYGGAAHNARVEDNAKWQPDPTVKQKLQLMMAAPKLLEALKDALSIIEDCADDTCGTPTQAFFQDKAKFYTQTIAEAEGSL